MTKTPDSGPVRNPGRYQRSTRSNAILRQFITFQRSSKDTNPIPFTVVLDTLRPTIEIEINKILHTHPLPPHLDRDDLFQECSATLLRCIQHFDPITINAGYKRPTVFISYFRIAIKRAMRDVLNSHNRIATDSHNAVPDYLTPECAPILDSDADFNDSHHLDSQSTKALSTQPDTATQFSTLLSTFLDDPVQVQLLSRLQYLPLSTVAIQLHLTTKKARQLANQALKTLRRFMKGNIQPKHKSSLTPTRPTSKHTKSPLLSKHTKPIGKPSLTPSRKLPAKTPAPPNKKPRKQVPKKVIDRKKEKALKSSSKKVVNKAEKVLEKGGKPTIHCGCDGLGKHKYGVGGTARRPSKGSRPTRRQK